MTIKYLDSKRIVGLSTDTFPTFEDDFTSYETQGAANLVWVEDGTGKVAVNITDNDIDFNLKTETTAHGINYDFGVGNVSDTEWIIRYKMNLTTVNTTTMYTYWGLSSVSGSGTSTTRDFIGFNTTGTTFLGHDRDGADDTGGGDNSQSYTLVTGTDYYVTIKRTSATAYAYTLQTGSFSGTTVVNGTGTCVDTIVGLRYFNCRNLNNQTTAGNLIGTIDDFEFYNGVTTPPTKPTDVPDNSIFIESDTFKRYGLVPALATTFSNNFSSTTNFLEQGGGSINFVDTANNELDYDFKRDGSNDSITLDLGSALSDDNWVARWQDDTDTYTTNSQALFAFIGLYSESSASDGDNSQDGIYCMTETSNSGNNGWKLTEADGSILDQTGTGSSLPHATGTRYFELSRVGNTSSRLRISSDSEFNTILANVTNSVPAGVTGLRYWGIKNRAISGDVGVKTGSIKNLQIYNGVSSVTPATWTRGYYKPPIFSGGNSSSISGGYTYRQFTTTGTQNFVNSGGSGAITALIVGGGGGGGAGWSGAGGGGGEVMLSDEFNIGGGTWAITVGVGGLSNGTILGGDTTFVTSIGTIIAKGGGTSNYDSYGTTPPGKDGGSGAGGNAQGTQAGGLSNKVAFPSGITGTIYGNAGGAKVGSGNSAGSGGGGGAGGAGAVGNSTSGGDGGDGVAIAMPTSYYWGGGGGGAAYRRAGGDGGEGSAGGSLPTGSGSSNGSPGANGINPATSTIIAGVNTGSGGGGGGGHGASTGGSGIVIIKHAT